MILLHSVSDPNVFLTYVCLVSGVKPNSNNNDTATSSGSVRTSYKTTTTEEQEDTDKPIQVERSKALHELVTGGSNNKKCMTCPPTINETRSVDNIELNGGVSNCVPNPNILKLTKMKWLTEKQEDICDSSSPSISSSSSTCSMDSKDGPLGHCISSGDKCLSTILRLDKEHNMFGLSNIAIVGAKISKKIRKENEKPAFPQTAIIQVCCGRRCCIHKSNTDLPNSLKCNGCHNCCFDPYCPTCPLACSVPCQPPSLPCMPPKCILDCCKLRAGMKIVLQKKPKIEPSPIELTPRSSCILQKPLAARSCHHVPVCIPPSSCFPYLLPCFWPSRPSAPCNHPSRCFHNPPCRAPRKKKSSIDFAHETCSKDHKCTDVDEKCPNTSCVGNNPAMKKAIKARFGGEKSKKEAKEGEKTKKKGKEGEKSTEHEGENSSKKKKKGKDDK